MIKGILSLFTSGVILNPMVLLGIFIGIFCYVYLTAEQITALFSDYRFYLLGLLIAFVYNFLFKKVYQEGGYNLDTGATLLNVLGSAFKLFLSGILLISFLSMLSLT